MSRSVYRFEEWIVALDDEPDAEPTVFGAQCAVCLNASDVLADEEQVAHWVRDHAGRHPSHHSYRELIQRPLRAWMPNAVNP